VHGYNEGAFSFQTAYGSGKPKAVWVFKAMSFRAERSNLLSNEEDQGWCYRFPWDCSPALPGGAGAPGASVVAALRLLAMTVMTTATWAGRQCPTKRC